MSRNPILVEDGETIVLIVRTQGPTVSDPADEYPYLSQAYRVVADRTNPTLVLVPLGPSPIRVSQNEIDQMNQRRLRGDLEEIFKLMKDPTFIFDVFVKTSGWKFSPPIIVEKGFDPSGTIPGPTKGI